MGDYKWCGDGIYTRIRQRRGGEPREIFYGQVWVSSQKRLRHFKLGTTLRQAKAKMRTIQGDPEKALSMREKRHAKVLTFGALLDEFLSKYRSRGGSGYYAHTTVPLRAYFGDTPVAEITTQALDRYLGKRRTETLQKRERRGERKVGESTLRKEIITLGTMFRWGKRRGLVNNNVVADYEKPKEPAERNIAILSPEQEEVLERNCPARVWDFVEWALYSGMRRGEVLRLRRRDIDQARGLIHTGSKTKSGTRTVPLNVSARLVDILQRQPRRIGSDLVFCERDGQPLNRDVLDRDLEGAAKAAGIDKQRGVLWNRLRHTWATRLLATGKVSIFEVSKWMGNSVAVCERHYAAYLPDSHRKAAGLLDAGRPTTAHTTS